MKKCNCTKNVIAENCYQSSYGVDTCSCNCHDEPERIAFDEWITQKLKNGKLNEKEWSKNNVTNYKAIKIYGEFYGGALCLKDKIIKTNADNRKDAIHSAWLDYLREN